MEPGDLLHLYQNGRHDELTQNILYLLSEFANQTVTDLNPVQQSKIDAFVECILEIFVKSDYTIPPRYREVFVFALPAMSNLVAASRFQNTDPQLEVLLKEPNTFAKILALYTPRNRIEIDRKWLFDQDPKLASMWYGRFFHAATSSRTQAVHEHLRRHLQYIDDQYNAESYFATEPIFFSTYIDAEVEKPIKEQINSAITHRLTNVQVRNRPDPHRIAVLTHRWFPGTSVYRAVNVFIEAMADKYDL
ncbi:unnamed protein product, partial [marine sediment metagenome]